MRNLNFRLGAVTRASTSSAGCVWGHGNRTATRGMPATASTRPTARRLARRQRYGHWRMEVGGFFVFGSFASVSVVGPLLVCWCKASAGFLHERTHHAPAHSIPASRWSDTSSTSTDTPITRTASSLKPVSLRRSRRPWWRCRCVILRWLPRNAPREHVCNT